MRKLTPDQKGIIAVILGCLGIMIAMGLLFAIVVSALVNFINDNIADAHVRMTKDCKENAFTLGVDWKYSEEKGCLILIKGEFIELDNYLWIIERTK